MLTMPTPEVTPPTTSGAASERGPRKVNADAVATYTDPATGRAAFVVADGVGDHLLAARSARLAARTAAEAAIRVGPAAALLEAGRALRAEFDEERADCVAVVAVLPEIGRPEQMCDIAWVGDCRAYRWNGGTLAQLTADHTLAEFWRAQGVTPEPRMEHVVIDSVRTAGPSDIGRTRTSSGAGRLLLSTDGVHKPLGIVGVKEILAAKADTREAATALVTAAHQLGGTDNASAVVVDR